MHQRDTGISSLRALTPVLALAALLLLLRIMYLAWFCPYTLIEDEANYWEWSRHLDWSYYTKGPGVAWAIAASTRLVGTSEFGVRLPAAISLSVATVCVGWLGWMISGRVRVAFVGALLFSLAPAFLALALLMTIDGPLVACWALAACLAYRGLTRASTSSLALFGLVLGIGVLFKYTALLLLPGVVLFAWRHRRDAKGTLMGWLLGLVLFMLAVAPIIVWNQREGWPTLAHQLGHLGGVGQRLGGDLRDAQEGWRYNPLWTLTLLGTLLGLGGVAIVPALGLVRDALQRRAPMVDADMRSGVSFCVWCGAPVLLLYLVVSLLTEPEGNWTLAATVTIFPLAGIAYVCGRERWSRNRPWSVRLAHVHIALGLVLGVLMLRADLASHVPGLSRVVPTGRFSGARVMGEHAGELVAELRASSGNEPMVIAVHYGRAAQLAFYMPGRPVVFAVSSLTPGGRRTSWDDWQSTRIRGNDTLLGRPALVVGLDEAYWRTWFSQARSVGKLRGDHKRNRLAHIALDFRGVPEDPQPHLPGGTLDPRRGRRP